MPVVFKYQFQENKDWNKSCGALYKVVFCFKYQFQENKDWNIEPCKSPTRWRGFKYQFQENKDWNPSRSIRFVIHSNL